MDSRPFRPRGTENVAPPLHQRHKSTGNIAAMASVAMTGFRGPAKRAAFGDVTNMAKNVGNGHADGKFLKPQASAIGLSQSTLNKENAPYRTDAFSRPAQRTAVLPNKQKVFVEDPLAHGLQTIPSGVQNSSEQFYNIGSETAQSHVAISNTLPAEAPPVPQHSLQPPPQQPRHHKSQPQLKQPQQPVLRKTQSRQLDKVTVPTEIVSASNGNVQLEAMLSRDQVHIGTTLAAIESDYLPSDQAERIDQDFNAEYVPLPSKLPGITEEVAPLPITYKDGPVPALSEPEELWDEEEEEEYDDQDQAYMTAHSFRSRDLTTGGATTVVAPRITAKVQRELEDARVEVERTRPQEDVEEEAWDVSMVAEYGDEIFEYMRELEIKMLPNPHYMDIQTEIQWSMRSVLMDWLVQVHSRFSLLPETLFLTVNYIDRFLSSKIVSIGKLQLVGATAILVASKYEEINCPSLQEIVYMVDKGYTTDEILKAERFMLSMLSFELGWPGPMSFLRRVSKADDYDLETRTLAKYFLELTIMDERFVATPPSFVAAGAHCLSRLILNKGEWTKAHVHYSGYTWSQLRSLVTMMVECCEHPTLHHQAVFEKYSEKRFKEASLIVQDAMKAGFTLPHHCEPVRRPEPSMHQDELSESLIYNGHHIPIQG